VNGTGTCDGADICVSICSSYNGLCEEPCSQIGLKFNYSLFNGSSSDDCDSFIDLLGLENFEGYGECFTTPEEDVLVTCNEVNEVGKDENDTTIINGTVNGTGTCDGADICVSICSSNNGLCEEPCSQIGLKFNESLYNGSSFDDCDDFVDLAGFENFEGYGECFTTSEEDRLVTCNEVNEDSKDKNDTAMIIGIVIGVILVVAAIVAVVIYNKSHTKL